MFYNAQKLKELMGEQLIGRTVDTQEIVTWAGCECTVIDLGSDPAAPEIVFNVRRLSDSAEIGVFDWEFVEWLPGEPVHDREHQQG